MKNLLYAVIAAAVCWILSEVLEIALGGRTASTLWLTAAFHFLIAFGIWGAYVGQADRKSTLSLIAAGMMSLGYLLLVYPPLAVSQAPSITITEFMDVNLIFKLAGLLAVLGTILFGVSILRQKSYVAWTGVALVLCPVIFSAIMMSEGPELVAIVANLVESVALIVISVQALRSKQVLA